MAKTSGLGDDVFVGGFHIGGDIQSLYIAGGPNNQIDVTDITQSGHARLGGVRIGSIKVVAYHDNAVSGTTSAHLAFALLPTADVIGTYLRGQAIGNPAACCNARQLDYNPTKGADGSLTFAVDMESDAFGLEWGTQLTAGARTDTAATNGTSFDFGLGFTTPAVPASGTPVTNTSPLPASVTVTAGTGTNVFINGVAQGTFDGTYTVPAGGTISLTYTVAPTWTWNLQTSFGAQAYLQAMSLTGTDVTVVLQDSADNVTFANITGGSFTQITSLPAPAAQRLATAGSQVIRRYVRAVTITTGGFTSFTFQVTIAINQVATVF